MWRSVTGMEYNDAYELRPGDRVTFTGGTGRNDADAVYVATVNGEPYTMQPDNVCYVPVYVPKTDQMVNVAHTNVIGLVVGA